MPGSSGIGIQRVSPPSALTTPTCSLDIGPPIRSIRASRNVRKVGSPGTRIARFGTLEASERTNAIQRPSGLQAALPLSIVPGSPSAVSVIVRPEGMSNTSRFPPSEPSSRLSSGEKALASKPTPAGTVTGRTLPVAGSWSQ